MLTRRELLAAIPAISAAAQQARSSATFAFFSAGEAADIEAIASEIIPTDDMPGAREAGVIWFIDSALAGYLREMQPAIRKGLTDLRAKAGGKFATLNAARAIKIDKLVGTLEVGKFADVIAVDGDPLADIACLQQKKNIQIVMKEGRVHADRRPGHHKNVVSAEPGSWKIVDYL